MTRADQLRAEIAGLQQKLRETGALRTLASDALSLQLATKVEMLAELEPVQERTAPTADDLLTRAGRRGELRQALHDAKDQLAHASPHSPAAIRLADEVVALDSALMALDSNAA